MTTEPSQEHIAWHASTKQGTAVRLVLAVGVIVTANVAFALAMAGQAMVAIVVGILGVAATTAGVVWAWRSFPANERFRLFGS